PPVQPPPAVPAGPLPEQFGRYRILRPLGKGGMGRVYLAHDTRLDIPVALKVPELPDPPNPEVLERFYRQARVAAQLDDPHLRRVYEVGEPNGTHCRALQYLKGRTLAQWLEDGNRLTDRQAVELVAKLAVALAKAHRLGIIHRDLKPANVMLTDADGG